MRIALPYLLWGRSATSDIPAIFGLERVVGLCISWRHRQLQRCFLHITDSIDDLEAVRPSMFGDITVSAVERLWLFSADIVWFEVV